MPLVAMSKQTGARIDITRYENPRHQLKSKDVVCPECEHPMILKAGRIKIAHFAHNKGSNCTYGVGERPEHLLAKRYLAEWLRTEGAKHFDVEVELEYKVGNRRADVIQIFPTGWMVAHEIQLAGITTGELQERTDDYLAAGCDVIWYLGLQANTPANRLWVQDYQWDVLTLDFLRTDRDATEIERFGEIRVDKLSEPDPLDSFSYEGPEYFPSNGSHEIPAF